MHWWTWLGIGFLMATVIFSVIAILWNRFMEKRESVAVEILKAEQAKAKEDLEAERLSRKMVEVEIIKLSEKQKEINSWYNRRKTEIKKGVRHEYETLVGNPDSLDSKLDKLLGLTNTSESAGEPQDASSGGETPESKEGDKSPV